MNKNFEMIYHFNDGTSWDQEELNLNSQQIAVAIDSLFANPDNEITAISTGETKKVSEIKSIELKV